MIFLICLSWSHHLDHEFGGIDQVDLVFYYNIFVTVLNCWVVLEFNFIIFFYFFSTGLTYSHDLCHRIWLTCPVCYLFFFNWFFFQFHQSILNLLEVDFNFFFFCIMAYPSLITWIVYSTCSLRLTHVIFLSLLFFFFTFFPI
jgi:hypothetical protein